ncbi:MAG: ATP-dependent DNA helicase, partial [Leptospirales bacterium]
LSDVDNYLKEKFGVTRETATPAQKRLASEHSREAKKVRELEGLQKEWQDRAKEIGSEKVVTSHVKVLSLEKRLEVARESLAFAIEHHTERESSVKEGELIRTALQAGRGIVTSHDIEKAVEEAKTAGSLIRQTDDKAKAKQNLMTCREALEREKRILKYERSGRHAMKPILNPLQAEAALKAIQEKEGLTLNEEQKAAARMILTTDNRYAGINGYAGVGKTTMLKPAVETLKEAGFRVIGLGPQHSAVHALKDAGIIEGRTLQSWLADRKAGESLDGKTVVVVDEAGLTNAKDLESAMKRIEKAGARAVLVGDVKQYESVAAGPVFRQLQENGMETVWVTEMQRQNKAEANVKEAAKLSIDSPEKALEKLEIREIRNPHERFKALSEEYLKSPDPRDTLVLTGTHEARKAVNEHVRESLGLVGIGHKFFRYEAGDFTEAQKKRIDAYEEGLDVRFGKDYRSMNVKSGEIGRVEDVDKENGTVCLKMQDGKDVTLTPRELSGKSHEIGKIEQIELSKGDRIRITGNERKKEGITNGMRGEVIESKHDTLKICLDSGKIFDLKPGGKTVEIDHGYAQTGHSAQGLGAETVILDLPSNSQTLNRRSFYTNLTRTKGQVKAFTDDREKLTGAVSREKDKTMALDVEKENKEEKRRAKESVSEKNTLEEGSGDRRETLPALTAEEKMRLEEWKGKEGRNIPFPDGIREFGIGAGEVGKIEDINRANGVITLRMEDGRHVRMIPKYMRDMEKESIGDEKREVLKDISKEKEGELEKGRATEGRERTQEGKAREESKNEQKRIPERERKYELERDGLGY